VEASDAGRLRVDVEPSEKAAVCASSSIMSIRERSGGRLGKVPYVTKGLQGRTDDEQDSYLSEFTASLRLFRPTLEIEALGQPVMNWIVEARLRGSVPQWAHS
jgi:hypothetical protein